MSLKLLDSLSCFCSGVRSHGGLNLADDIGFICFAGMHSTPHTLAEPFTKKKGHQENLGPMFHNFILVIQNKVDMIEESINVRSRQDIAE